MSLCIFESPWKIKGIDTLIGIEIDIEVSPSYGLYESSILILWIQNNHICPEHKGTKDFEFDSK